MNSGSSWAHAAERTGPSGRHRRLDDEDTERFATVPPPRTRHARTQVSPLTHHADPAHDQPGYPPSPAYDQTAYPAFPAYDQTGYPAHPAYLADEPGGSVFRADQTGYPAFTAYGSSGADELAWPTVEPDWPTEPPDAALDKALDEAPTGVADEALDGVPEAPFVPAPAVSPESRTPDGSPGAGRVEPSAEEPTRPVPVAGASLRDRLRDTGPHGLRAFNLGSVPASVTPPRSWRRAAWFTIAASAAALLGLLFAMSALVGPRGFSRITALPALPTGLPTYDPMTALPEPSGLHRPSGPARTGRSGPQESRSAPHNGSGGREDPVGGVARGGPVAPGAGPTADEPGPGTGQPTAAGPVPAPTPPEVTTVSAGPAATDPGMLSDRTQQFFAEVTTDASAAARLTTGAAQDDATAIIRQRYGDVSSIQVQSIQLDPSKGVTVSLLHVRHKDGTTSTEQQTLNFTLNSDPKIKNPAG